MRITRNLALSALTICLAGQVYAIDLGFARQDGGRPGAFLSYGAGARALGMGKAFTGVSDDASAVYWNPAGLGQLQQREVTAVYANMYEDTSYGFAGYAHPLGNRAGTLGVAIVSLDSKGFPLKDEFNTDRGEGSVSETAAILSYGRSLFPTRGGISATGGASVKAVRQIVDARSAMGYGVDAGILCRIGERATAGLSIQNIIAPRLKIGEVTDEYPLSVTAGAGYRAFDNNLLFAVDVNKTDKREYKLHVGGEYCLAHMVYLRGGIDETEMTCGLGFRFKGYAIDYAFAFHDAWQGQDDLGSSHRFGVTVKF